MREGVLVRKWESSDGSSVRWLIVLPRGLREQVLEDLCVAGPGRALGPRSALAAVRENYYWIGLARDVQDYLLRHGLDCRNVWRAGAFGTRRGGPGARIEPGDFVWVWDGQESGSVDGGPGMSWQGPYMVLAKLSGGAVRVQRSRDSRPTIVNMRRLTLCKGLELDPWTYTVPVVRCEEGPFLHRR